MNKAAAMPTPSLITILDPIQNKIGAFTGASAVPPPNSKSATVAAAMPPAEMTDPSNTLRLGVEADFGAGFKAMAWGPLWTGGPGKTAPALAWQFDATHPPQRVRGVLENVTQVVAGLTIAFA